MHGRGKLVGVMLALAMSAGTSLSAPAQAVPVRAASVGSVRRAVDQQLAAATPCVCVNKPEYRYVRSTLGASPHNLDSLVKRYGTTAQGKDIAGQTYLVMVPATAKGAPKLKKRVPYPSYQAKSAKKHRRTKYSVYWIYGVSKGPTVSLITWKFGITRQANENSRPRSQYRECMKYFGSGGYQRCRHEILKRVVGWFPARTAEADYTLAYALNHGGRCPPGMPACL